MTFANKLDYTLERLVAVISSCVTIDQLSVATRYSTLMIDKCDFLNANHVLQMSDFVVRCLDAQFVKINIAEKHSMDNKIACR